MRRGSLHILVFLFLLTAGVQLQLGAVALWGLPDPLVTWDWLPALIGGGATLALMVLSWRRIYIPYGLSLLPGLACAVLAGLVRLEESSSSLQLAGELDWLLVSKGHFLSYPRSLAGIVARMHDHTSVYLFWAGIQLAAAAVHSSLFVQSRNDRPTGLPWRLWFWLVAAGGVSLFATAAVCYQYDVLKHQTIQPGWTSLFAGVSGGVTHLSTSDGWRYSLPILVTMTLIVGLPVLHHAVWRTAPPDGQRTGVAGARWLFSAGVVGAILCLAMATRIWAAGCVGREHFHAAQNTSSALNVLTTMPTANSFYGATCFVTPLLWGMAFAGVILIHVPFRFASKRVLVPWLMLIGATVVSVFLGVRATTIINQTFGQPCRSECVLEDTFHAAAVLHPLPKRGQRYQHPQHAKGSIRCIADEGRFEWATVDSMFTYVRQRSAVLFIDHSTFLYVGYNECFCSRGHPFNESLYCEEFDSVFDALPANPRFRRRTLNIAVSASTPMSTIDPLRYHLANMDYGDPDFILRSPGPERLTCLRVMTTDRLFLSRYLPHLTVPMSRLPDEPLPYPPASPAPGPSVDEAWRLHIEADVVSLTAYDGRHFEASTADDLLSMTSSILKTEPQPPALFVTYEPELNFEAEARARMLFLQSGYVDSVEPMPFGEEGMPIPE